MNSFGVEAFSLICGGGGGGGEGEGGGGGLGVQARIVTSGDLWSSEFRAYSSSLQLKGSSVEWFMG